MSSSSRLAFNPTCPKGGTWYACSTGSNFVGCCGVNPCASTCAQGSLYPAAFTASSYGTFPDASCPSGSNFYTCTGTSPIFMGCCKTGSNPCSLGTCPADSLVPAFLGSDYLKSSYGAVPDGGGGSSSLIASRSTSSSVGASTLATIATSSAATTPTSAAIDSLPPRKSSTPVAAIAGGAAGGALALVLAIALLIYYCCHAKKSRQGHAESVARRASDLPAVASVSVQGKGGEIDEPPPSYVSPNPNEYYGVQAGRYHQYLPEPQELACETGGVPSKFVGHQRNLSELSGETTLRSEMESPHVAVGGSPVRQHGGWQVSPGGYHNASSWTPQQNWQTQTGEGYGHGPSQGLGLYGSDANSRTTTH